jgi:hypothetical protein
VKRKAVIDSLSCTTRLLCGMRTVKFINSTLVVESLKSQLKISRLNTEENRWIINSNIWQ